MCNLFKCEGKLPTAHLQCACVCARDCVCVGGWGVDMNYANNSLNS